MGSIERERFIERMLNERSSEDVMRFLRERLIDALAEVFNGDEEVIRFARSVVVSGRSVEEIESFSSKYSQGRIVRKERVQPFLRNALYVISGLRNIDEECLLEQPGGVWEFLEHEGFPDELIASYFEDYKGSR